MSDFASTSSDSRVRRAWQAYLALAALQCLAALALALRTHSESGGLLGFSPGRLLLAAPILAALLGFGWLLLETWRQPERTARRRERLLSRLGVSTFWWKCLVVCGAVFLAGALFLALAPGFQEPVAIALAERLTPLIGLALGVAVQSLAALLIFRRRDQAEARRPAPRLFWMALLASLAALMAWAWVVNSVLPDESTRVGWNRMGAPVIEIQVFLAWAASTALMALTAWGNRSQSERRGLGAFLWKTIDIWLSILIWVIAAAAWQSAPITPNWFLNRPFPPNFELYPSSDARAYDVVSQSALIGRGYVFYGMPYIRRSLLAFYMTLLHVAGGQDYNRVIFVQILVLALIPVVLYQLARKLHNRYSAVILAGLVIGREANSIRISGNETTSNVKLLMADMPTVLLVTLFGLLLIIWLKRLQNGQSTRVAALAAGGGLGLCMLVRLETTVLLLPVMLVAALELWPRRQRRLWLAQVTLLLVGAGLVISPWVTRNYIRTGMVYIDDPYFMYDLLFQRYHPERNDAPDPQDDGATMILPEQPAASSTPASPKVKLAISSWQAPQPTPAPSTPVPRDQIQQETNRTLGYIRANLGPVTQSVVAHFLNSQVQMFLILPTTQRGFESTLVLSATRSPGQWWAGCCQVESYVRALPYWERWDGSIPTASQLLLAINMALAAWGMQTAWRRARWAGLTPAFLAITYLAFNSLFRNSGGRYILPVDWSMLLFFSIGLAQLTQDLGGKLSGSRIPEAAGSALTPAALPEPQKATDRPRPLAWAGVVAALLLIGSLIPLLEVSFPRRYPPQAAEQMSARLFQSPRLSQEQALTLRSALQNGAVQTAGRALYPRFIAANVKDPGGRGKLFEAQPIPRMTFFLAGDINRNMVFPIERKPKKFPNASDVLVITCPDLDILALALYAPDGALQDLLLRAPFPAGNAGCPLPAQSGNRQP